MQIENKFLPRIPVDSQAESVTANLLGTKFINIRKGRSALTVQPGAVIFTDLLPSPAFRHVMSEPKAYLEFPIDPPLRF